MRDVYEHFPLVTKGNMDGDSQVDLSRTKGWRNKRKKRKTNLQKESEVLLYTQTEPQHETSNNNKTAQRHMAVLRKQFLLCFYRQKKEKK